MISKIRVRKSDIAWNFLSFGLRSLSNVLLIPFVLIYIPSQYLGLWYIFISIGSITDLVDFGFSTNFVRQINYALSGALSIEKEGLSKSEANEPNLALFFRLFLFAKELYFLLSLVIFIFMLIFGTLYIDSLIGKSMNNVLVFSAWAIFLVSHTFEIYTNSYTVVYKGLGKIKKLQQIDISSHIIYIISSLCLLYLGWSLLGIVIATSLSFMFKRFFYVVYIQSIIKVNYDIYFKIKRNYQNHRISIFNKLLPNSIKSGIIMISSFLYRQAIPIILSRFFTLTIIAQHGVTTQIVSFIMSISLIPIRAILVELNALKIEKKQGQFIKKRNLALVFMLFVMIAGCILLLLFGNPILNLIKPNTNLLDSSTVFCICLYYVLLNITTVSTDIISTSNRIPHAFSFLVTSLLGILLIYILGYNNKGILHIYIGLTIISVLFNAWYWPLVMFRNRN